MMNDSFTQAIAPLHLLNHPFYQAWMAGSLSTEELRNYASQYYFHVDRFPRYLSSIHSHCEDTNQRRKILENLNEEEGTEFGVSHPELWLQFAEGLGVDSKAVRTGEPCAAIQHVMAQFFASSRSSLPEGLGALYAYESQIPEIAESKLEGLRNRYGIHDERTLAFFEVHRQADIEHRLVILEMLESLPEPEKIQARASAHAAAQTLWDFLTAMYTPRQVHA